VKLPGAGSHALIFAAAGEVKILLGKVLWEPDEEWKRRANITGYTGWLERERGVSFRGYRELWGWSVDRLEDFWQSISDYFGVRFSRGYSAVLDSRKMPGARWFAGATLNYAEHVFAARNDSPAMIHVSENGQREVSWNELESSVSSLAVHLRGAGVGQGDRVAAYIPNVPEAVIAFLACASIGAVWSSCSPDFGVPSVLDRFRQIEPKVLVASDGYSYGGRFYERSSEIEEIRSSLPTLKETIVVAGGRERSAGGTVEWEEAVSGGGSMTFEHVEFGHPLWILYSSGTTGLPKPIVHGHGGILLEHLKVLSLHNDIKKGDRFFWFTTTGWMMWNYLISGLLLGATIVLYDGSPSFPDMNAIWELAEKKGVTFLGTSAPYINSCMKAGIKPGETHTLDRLRGIGSTGSPLSPEGFEWVYGKVKEDIWLASISGGTDLCTAFVGGCPTLPVLSGVIQCRCLGAKVESYGEDGRPRVGEVGELVITEPMPSMPSYFWGDRDGSRYRESYFEMFPGVWRHGDWIEIREDGGCVIYGRSDATIKRMGVRIGSSEIYRVVESIQEVADSLVVDIEGREGVSYMPLFVVLAGDRRLDEGLKRKIAEKIRSDLSPRYVPDEIIQVEQIPRTLNGKRMEVPVKRILMGVEPSRAFNRGSMANPEAMDSFISIASRLKAGSGKL